MSHQTNKARASVTTFSPETHHNKPEEHEEKEDNFDEDIDLEEVLKALSEEEESVEENSKVEKLQAEINEHRNVVKYLRSKLN